MDQRNAASGRSAFYNRNPQEVADERERAREAGREEWMLGTREGRSVLARTEAELEALGRSVLARKARAAAQQVGRAIGNPQNWREAGLQLDTAVRGAAHTLSGGNENMIAAGADALLGRGGPGGFTDRFRTNLAREEARDDYDRGHRSVARAVGETGGLALAYKLGERGGANWSKKLGELGERLSQLKTVASGDFPVASQVKLPVSGGFTRADHATLRGKYAEAKLGSYARLRPRQREAVAEYPSAYRVDRWQDQHVGRVAGAGAAAAVWPFNGDDDW
jgi:hypothetical protein